MGNRILQTAKVLKFPHILPVVDNFLPKSEKLGHETKHLAPQSSNKQINYSKLRQTPPISEKFFSQK